MQGELNVAAIPEQPGMSLENAQAMVAALTLKNADEVLPDEVEVEIGEWYAVEETDAEGKPRKRNKLRKRIAHLPTFVPMSIFIRLIKSQQEMSQGLAKAGPEASMRWMTEQVLNVWKLSEPEMTLDTLTNGVQGEKIMELFFHFFGGMLSAATRIKALLGSDSPNQVRR